MNSEELEQSLRTEFESYLKNVFAEMRQEVAEFQEKIEAEFTRHKSQLDEVFQDFSARIAEDKQLDVSFKESIIEHFRLAKDEGARITVAAMEEAEAMEKESAEMAVPAIPAAGISEIRDAINDISTKNTQSSILKALVQHAAEFTPRGAFFIIKNEHLVGWRVFGKEGTSDEEAVREVFFPVAASTVLGEAVRSLSAVESAYGAYSDDSIYLNRLEFGQPDKMFAIPLVVRGRSVAVLYADYGSNGDDVNIEALETLARVASLTVEVLASARAPKPETSEQAQYAGQPESFDEQDEFESAPREEFEAAEETVEETVAEEPVAEEISEFVSSEEDATQAEFAQQDFEIIQPEVSEESAAEEFAEPQAEEISEPQAEFQPVADESWSEADETPEAQEEASYAEPVAETEDFSAPATLGDYEFETSQSFETEPAQFEETSPVFEPTFDAGNQFETVESYAPAQESFGNYETENGKAETYVPEPAEQIVEPVAAKPAKTRFSDRNVDLPIEVDEQERRLHNDARRFARLLVSEIKLYNEQKVKEGRDASDLYERLREAIDRSREMYDKRVQPPVAARFDYFHYEVVNTLAEGDENKLGGSYPGAVV